MINTSRAEEYVPQKKNLWPIAIPVSFMLSGVVFCLIVTYLCNTAFLTNINGTIFGLCTLAGLYAMAKITSTPRAV